MKANSAAVSALPTWRTDIRFWLVVFLLAQLIGIWDSPIDRWDSWRQAITAMTTRNLLEIDSNLFYPRVDFAGNLSGIVGMEFPIFNGLAALLTWMLGLEVGSADFVARFLNLVFTNLGVYFFYRSLVEFGDKSIAFPAAMLLLCSLWMLYGRKVMPDTFAAGLGLMGTYYGLKFAARGALPDVIRFGVLMSIAMLSKISVAFMLAYPFMSLLRQDHRSYRLSALLWAFFGVLALVSLWYFWWVPTLRDRFGFDHFFMGRPLYEGWSQIVQNLPHTLERFTKTSLGYAGSLFLFLGLVYSVRDNKHGLLFSFVGGFFAFLPFVIKAGFNFFHHNYYVVPFVPALCAMAGYGVSVLLRKNLKWLVLLVLAVFVLEQGSRLIRDQRSEQGYLLTLEARLDAVSSRQDLILVNSGDDPTPMYFAHRRGWLLHDEQIKEASHLDELAAKGLKFVVLIRHRDKSYELPARFALVHEDAHFQIYRVMPAQAPSE